MERQDSKAYTWVILQWIPGSALILLKQNSVRSR
jgi:hypothetical protein